MKKIMNKGNGKLRKEVMFFILGIAVAVLCSAPYMIFRDYLEKLPLTGYIGLFISCMVANSTVFLPASSILYVLSASTVLNQWICCLVGGIGSAIGEQAGYFCGCAGNRVVKDTLFFQKVSRWLNKHDFFTVFIFAVLPVPVFDVAGVAAGSCHMKWHIFTLASILGKMVKMFLTVFTLYHVMPSMLELLPAKFAGFM